MNRPRYCSADRPSPVRPPRPPRRTRRTLPPPMVAVRPSPRSMWPQPQRCPLLPGSPEPGDRHNLRPSRTETAARTRRPKQLGSETPSSRESRRGPVRDWWSQRCRSGHEACTPVASPASADAGTRASLGKSPPLVCKMQSHQTAPSARSSGAEPHSCWMKSRLWRRSSLRSAGACIRPSPPMRSSSASARVRSASARAW